MTTIKKKLISLAVRIAAKMSHFAGFGFAGRGSIEWEVKNAMMFVANPRVIFDIGANNGDYSKSLLRTTPNCTIHLFEPDAKNFRALQASFSSSDHRLNQLGVSSENGQAILYSDKEGSGLSSLSKRRLDHFGTDFNHEVSIELIRLDHYIKRNKLEVIDFIKMDIEGHELAALEGIGSHIRNISCIQFEFGGANIDSRTFLQDFYYFFNKHEFRLYRLTRMGAYPISKYTESLENFHTSVYYAVNERK